MERSTPPYPGPWNLLRDTGLLGQAGPPAVTLVGSQKREMRAEAESGYNEVTPTVRASKEEK